MAAPKTGKPVREPHTGRPIMVLLDLLGRRWALRIIWELRDEPFGFRALQARCDGMSPSVLSQRLLELQAASIVLQDEQGSYCLSPQGSELFNALAPLHDWAQRWAARDGIEAHPVI